MPKYKFKKNFKTLIQIFLFYYFLNTLNLYKCLPQNDVELINTNRYNDMSEVSDIYRQFSDDSPSHGGNMENSLRPSHKNVNLNVNNNLYDAETITEHPDSNQHTEIEEDSIIGEKTLYLSESPYLLRKDLEVRKHGRLLIEPGVHIHFAPQVGITVIGELRAIGDAGRRISFSTQQNSGYPDAGAPDLQSLGARLVDGPSPLEGRLQLFHSGKWRSVCTNSRNWTIPDYETVCRQMGFQGGRFWNWVEKLQNYDARLLYEEPECRGVEHSLVECAWSSRQIGSGVCDYHNDIGVQCLPLLEKASSHWRGLKFENAESNRVLAQDNTMYDFISKSELRYVDIIRAGSGRGRVVSAAIDVFGVPPVLQHVLVDYSAYTGINVTRHLSAFHFHDVTVRRSRGFGIFVNSSFGAALLEDCNVSDNGADGIRYVGHDLRADERTDRNNIFEFCTLPITSGQTYPIELQMEQTLFNPTTKQCEQKFSTRYGYVLTVHFVNFEINTNETAQFTVYDGTSSYDRVLTEWSVRNYTRVQSVMSTREHVFIRFKAEPRSPVLAFLRVTSGISKSYDLNVTGSVVSDNNGRGIAVDNLRSQVHVHASAVSNNNHVAGIHVTSGAGDVNVTDSHVSFNQGDGVNVTYYGGNRNISRSSLSSNQGYGFAVWLNQTNKDRTEFLPVNQTSTIEYSNIVHNLEIGVLHGNFCGDFWVNITGNLFNESLAHGIDIQTCWFDGQDDKKLHLQIGHNRFDSNHKIGIIIEPALNMEGKIEYNHFQNGKYGAILIRNEPFDEFSDLFRTLPAKIYVQQNQFYNNKGVYVVSLGLTPYSDPDFQWILFTRNFVKNNKIEEPFENHGNGEGMFGEGRLNPRSRVAAAVVISSSNVDVFRNIISNHDSNYEVGSQVSDQSQILNVTYNWLGSGEEEKIFNRIFHRKDRYDLAKIEYLPYLLHNSNPGTSTIIQHRIFVPRFHHDGTDRVGGEVDGQEILQPGSYIVERDINIRPGGKLILQSGVTLNFSPSVGMMIAGKLEARGRSPDDILFTLKREPVMLNNETTEALLMDAEVDMNTEPIFKKDEIPTVPVRLLGGKTEHEGRLQVYLDGKWGTVCDYGWTIIDAALVCHQLGLALNPIDWRLQRSEIPGAGTTEDILLSHVRCLDHDTDITKCRAERHHLGEFENSCSHEMDVGVRCYEGAWAGMRFGVLAERADLQYLTIEKAGLFDYTTNLFKPAMQMDFARHNLDNVRVVDNLHDGLGIIYSDVFGGGAINNVKNSEFSGNRGNGISFKQLGLRVHGSIIKGNRGAGINHDPVLSAKEQRELTGWFDMAPDFNNLDSEYHPIVIPGNSDEPLRVDVDQWTMKHIITSRQVDAGDKEYEISIRCQPGYVIGIQLLNPIENRSTENIFIYDSQTGNMQSAIWQVKRDLSVFPVTSSSYGVVLKYKSGLNGLGGVVLTLSAISAPVQNIYNRIVQGPVPTLKLTSTKIQQNSRGIMATYYNRYLGEKSEVYLRKSNESIKLVNCEISYNRNEAFFIHAPFWDVHESNISEITFHINSSTVMDNGRGLRQFSKDLRSSNNLFHYVLQDTVVERNSLGGLEISLPYVWQYNENFTHSIFLGNNTWTRNEKFGIVIDGHYAGVNITGNTFSDNHCQNGLIAFKGMEKKLRIENNKISSNTGKYMVEFDSDSQSEILGEVFALFTNNDIKNNQVEDRIKPGGRSFFRGTRNNPTRSTCVIGFGGVQKVQIYRNLIANNDQDYDLVAGVKSARLNNFLDARENWWGSNDPNFINKRVFDFDDWNNHAEALVRPYLLEDNVFGSISVSFHENRTVDLDNLGGRIYNDMQILNRGSPYIVKSDITVMPEATLTIQGGVELQFSPNVGILVLGSMIARGARDSEIVMRPTMKISEELNRVERSLENLVIQDSIRLCTNRNCSVDESETDRATQGFLEYFNHTTLQWIPICDRRFTERNAQVVCRELGYDPLNIFFGHDRRIEFHTNSLTRIWSWVEPLECHGDEMRMEECPERLNGQLYGRRHDCKWDDEFVFISCNGEADSKPYWGGIRFANSDFENHLYEHRIHDSVTHETGKKKDSFLEFVRIERAGLLHGEKSPAVQTITKTPMISSVTIKDSAHHGVNLISPSDAIHLQFLNIENTLGQGVNAISLTGEGRESDESSYTPLRDLDLPYNLFSMIDICDTTKVITIEERVLIYYKYDNNPVNCVKIFNSAYRVKPLGFRLLQSNLFNHSKEYGRRDSIHLFDGDIYNVSARAIGTIESQSDNEKRLFKTIEPVLSIRLIASGAPARHGFIAEVVTLPISAIGFNRDAQHNISNSEITGTMGAAISYHTAGEVSPVLTVERNRIFNNCRQLYGNFSTCEAAVRVDVQNMQSFYFRNNLVKENQGGLSLRADSRGSATSLRGWIHHNLFVRNKNRPVLYVEGRQSSPYQEVIIYKNYVTQNMAGFDDVIVLRQVVSNFSMNYVHSNVGGRIIEISGFDKVRLPIYQTTSHNGFYSNVATDWRGRATVVAGTAGQHYVDNIFFNPDNDYEMITINRSIFEYHQKFWNSTLDVWKTKIDAAHNYWNWNETLAVGSRIKDRSDDPLLLEVSYLPLHMNNLTVLDGGKCPPGWTLVFDTCYMYVGAPMTFYEARDFCRSDNASLPFIRGDYNQLFFYLQRQMSHLRWSEHVWVQDLDYLNQCTAFVYRSVEFDDCNTRNAFICEIDPKIIIDPIAWQADIIAISVVSLFLAFLFLLCIVAYCWWAKSKTRHVQRLQRRNSIRQSLRSLNTIDPQGSMRRRNYSTGRSNDSLSKSTGTDYKKMMSNGSIDSMDKSVLSSDTSYDHYDPTNPQKFNEYAIHPKKYSPPDTPPKPKIYGLPSPMTDPSAFELSYRNEGFKDNSTIYTNTTRNSSVGTALNDEDIPIIHQVDDLLASDFYGNSSTLPMRAKGENLTFLNELKNRLPEYEAQPRIVSGHSSFLPANQSQHSYDLPSNQSQSSTLPYDQKVDRMNFTPTSDEERRPQPQTRRPNAYIAPPPDIRRPDSYMKALNKYQRTSILPKNNNSVVDRPRTLYESSGDDKHIAPIPVDSRISKNSAGVYARSKSEALLETNFDEAMPPINQLSADNRSYSQPLETAM